MTFGYFDDVRKEYVITTPGTPFPWINYLGQKDFFSLVSNTGGGYSFYRDARLRRLTRYRYNNVPLDTGGRYFYIRDGASLWSPGWRPVNAELDAYSCRHGLGYTVITGEKNGLTAELLLFVPLSEPCEIQRLTLRNKTGSVKQVRLFSFMEFCLWNALDDMTNFQRNYNTGEVEVEGSVIYHCTEYRERRNHFAFYSLNTPIRGFDTDREVFVGLYNGLHLPRAVEAGKSGNSIAHGWAPMASHFLEIELKPGEEKTLTFILGYGENPADRKWDAGGRLNKEPALRIIEKFGSDQETEHAFGELEDYWKGLLSKISVECEDPHVPRMLNIWNQYQCMVTFNLARSASYFESGIGRGIGFRDTCQDMLGCMHQEPERVRERLRSVAAVQFPDGSAYHQYQPLTGKGNADIGGNFNDDPLWLVLAVCAYIKETGDTGILKEDIPFDNGAGGSGTMFEHLLRATAYTRNNCGSHGLPLIGRADWNDCLNLNCFSENPDESFQTGADRGHNRAESVFIAGLFVFAVKEFCKVLTYAGMNERVPEITGWVRDIEQAAIRNGWDGDWFLRAYDDNLEKIGSRDNEEGKIFIEPQGMCGMAEIGRENGLPEKALDSVRSYLNTKHGIVLVHPAYKTYRLNLGEISTYPPGYKENGGVFCHNNPWIMIAETRAGRGDNAFEYYLQICPSYVEAVSEIHKTEPYAYAQMIAGKEASVRGEAKNSWLTGTAAWNMVALSQWILGIRPEPEGLRMDPCIPSNWKGYNAKRVFRGATYNIRVLNPHGVCSGVSSVTLDGNTLADSLVPIQGSGSSHSVEVVLGNPSNRGQL